MCQNALSFVSLIVICFHFLFCLCSCFFLLLLLLFSLHSGLTKIVFNYKAVLFRGGGNFAKSR